MSQFQVIRCRWHYQWNKYSRFYHQEGDHWWPLLSEFAELLASALCIHCLDSNNYPALLKLALPIVWTTSEVAPEGIYPDWNTPAGSLCYFDHSGKKHLARLHNYWHLPVRISCHCIEICMSRFCQFRALYKLLQNLHKCLRTYRELLGQWPVF